MGFNIWQFSIRIPFHKVILSLFLLSVVQASPVFSQPEQNSTQVSVSIAVSSHIGPAQPFAGRNLPEGKWVGGTSLLASSFPSADVQSVIISPVSAGEGTIADNRLWIKSDETGNQFIPLSELSSRILANPNANQGARLPDLEFRPTWEDAPGKYKARLKITSAVNETATDNSGIIEFEADVPSFMSFQVENSAVRFISSETNGILQGEKNILVHVTTNSDQWKIQMTSNQDAVSFELVGQEKGRQGPISSFSSGTSTVSGRQPVHQYLLAFKPTCPVDKKETGPVQVVVEGRTGL